MFISTDQTERDSATAYRTVMHRFTHGVVPVTDLPSLTRTGMTIEVLGTVLGTAIQGQIVGGTSDCPADLDAAEGRNVSKFTVSTVSLDESVRIATFFHLSFRRMRVTVNWVRLSTETSVHDLFRGHLHHLPALYIGFIPGRERAKRYESVTAGCHLFSGLNPKTSSHLSCVLCVGLQRASYTGANF